MILKDFLGFIIYHLYQLSAYVWQLWRHNEDAFFLRLILAIAQNHEHVLIPIWNYNSLEKLWIVENS